MSENFLSYTNNLKNWVPAIPVELCKLLVNRARRDIYDSRLWSFLIVESQLTSPALISVGSATFTKFSNQVTGDAIASAAWTGLNNPFITMRQIRRSGGPIYNVTAADFSVPAAVVLTLDRPYQETTGAAQAYNLYQNFYPPTDPLTNAPTADFVKWISIYDPINGYPLKLNYTQEYLNRIDPLRGAVGQPYRVASYKTINDSNGDPIQYYELWPGPTDGISRKCLYKKGGLDWRAPTDALPSELPVELLELRARYRAYEWANVNQGAHPELQKINWLAMRQELMNPRDRASYPYLLAKAKAEDENRMVQNYVSRPGYGWAFPIDSNFLQSHSWSWDWPGGDCAMIYMFPCYAVLYFVNGVSRKSSYFRDFGWSDANAKLLDDFTNLHFGELCSAIILASANLLRVSHVAISKTILFLAIINVIGLSSDEDVEWIAAFSIVAGVKSIKWKWVYSELKEVCNAMRLKLRSRDLDNSISSVSSFGNPRPALIVPFASHFRPKVTSERFWKIWDLFSGRLCFGHVSLRQRLMCQGSD